MTMRFDDGTPAGSTHATPAPNAEPSNLERWMREALREAQEAAASGEVPVGAILVDASGTVLSRGRNTREASHDPTGHAEMHALRDAAQALGHWRLEGVTVYVTLEPCPMCAGALVNARIKRLVYGCADPKAGAVDTLFNIGQDPRLNHRFEVVRGVLEAECGGALKTFFGALRARALRRRGGPAPGERLAEPVYGAGESGERAADEAEPVREC